jgi:glycosyltransferase involved in cell wall biosynthesis
MDIILLSDFFYPKFQGGGPVKSIFLLYKYFSNLGYKVSIITSSSNLNKSNSIPFNSNFIYINLFQRIIFLLNLPINSVLWVNSFFSPFTIIICIFVFFGLIKNKIILSPRGEVSIGALKFGFFKKKIWLYIFKLLKLNRFFILHFTAVEEKLFYEYYFKSKINSFVLSNLIDKDIYNFNKILRSDGPLKIVSIGRISAKKNLEFIFKVLNLVNCEVIFHLYGPNLNDNYFHMLMEDGKNLPPNISFSYLGSLEPVFVPSTLISYDLYFSPSLNENFGHGIFEAMQVGVVPLISSNTPWCDINSIYPLSFSLADINSFVNTIENLSIMSHSEFSIISSEIRRKSFSFVKSQNYDLYRDVIGSLLHINKNQF